MESIHESVKEYYGKELSQSEDLKTNACCTISEPPQHIKEVLSKIHDEVITKYYGCGLTIPDAIEGLHLVDLGCGSGRDVYLSSSLVGPKGQVTGIDMTDEQLDVAIRHQEYHRDAFGHQSSNVRFLKGNLDRLDEIDIVENSVDVIISNCVINLVEDKQKVLNDAFRLLKPGGEIYFSDVYCDRRVPAPLRKDPILWGECLSGALYWNDFLNIAKKAGFSDPRSVESNPIAIENKELSDMLGDLQFFSVTYRLFKIDGLETDCEDYGQAVAYRGTVKHGGQTFTLDDHHDFPQGKIISVCGNTYKMLYDTRYREHFDFYGSWDTHFGIFEGCGGSMPFTSVESGEVAGCC